MKFSEKEEARKRRKEVGKSSKQRKIGRMSIGQENVILLHGPLLQHEKSIP